MIRPHLRSATRRVRQAAMLPRRPAFSLMEVIIVTLIMGILAATAAPTFYKSLQYNRLETASRRLKIDLELLRNTARLKSKSETWTFTFPATYSLSADVAQLDRSTGSYAVDLSKSPYSMDAVTINFNGQSSVTFDGYGSPSRGGTVLLKAGQMQRTVTLDASSGSVTITP